jgi:hypothetical protein
VTATPPHEALEEAPGRPGGGRGAPPAALAERERGIAAPWIDTREMDRLARDATVFTAERAWKGVI